jgi:hypothetical protein
MIPLITTLYAETDGRIGIEVTDSHETGPVKMKALKRAGHIVLELKMIIFLTKQKSHQVS